MDKKSIIFIIVASLVMALFFGLVMPRLTKDKAPSAETTAASPVPTATPSANAGTASVSAAGAALKPAISAEALAAQLNPGLDGAEETTETIKTDRITAVFSNKGGQIVSLMLNNDKGVPIEMILKGDKGSWAFTHGWGDDKSLADLQLMKLTKLDDYSIEFSRVYLPPSDPTNPEARFTLYKRYTFKPGENMFSLEMKIVNGPSKLNPPGVNGKVYSIFYGPQLGPAFKTLSNYGESRTYISYSLGKMKSVRLKQNATQRFEEPMWTAMKGKYFSLIAIPANSAYNCVYVSKSIPGLAFASQLSLSRKDSNAPLDDKIYFYVGPNQQSELARYDNPEKNGFGQEDLKLGKITAGSWMSFSWLGSFLKQYPMNFFYWLIPNWGIAIILLTILVKLLLFPLTLKSSIGMAKMSELQPKLAELQAKYKDKPDRYQKEMMEFYKKEGYNPLAGCLPMLIQIPIFFAMYSLFSTNFDLFGQAFIPGWISDLSQPESILNFPRVNLIIWSVDALRILPIIYVVSQLFYGKFTQMSQPSPGQSATQMKLMLYGMPIFFFFILYNAPAGLLVYWITQNLLTIVQQMATNKIIHNRKMRQRSS